MPHLQRLNESLRDLIQRGILLEAERGPVNAWIFMKEHGVSDIVMLRVLSRPDQRRPSDNAALQYARGDGLPLRY